MFTAGLWDTIVSNDGAPSRQGLVKRRLHFSNDGNFQRQFKDNETEKSSPKSTLPLKIFALVHHRIHRSVGPHFFEKDI